MSCDASIESDHLPMTHTPLLLLSLAFLALPACIAPGGAQRAGLARDAAAPTPEKSRTRSACHSAMQDDATQARMADELAASVAKNLGW
jgi:hypothetical protein